MSFPRYPEYKDSGVEWLGDVPAHWTIAPLKSVSTEPGTLFIDGDWIESKDLSDAGIRYITTGNIGEGRYKEQGTGYITKEKFYELRCTEVFPGDVLLSRLNVPIGRSCLAPNIGERLVTSVDNVIIRADSRICRSYLVHALSSKHHFANMDNLARGTTMQRISRTALGNVRFALPPHSEQISIASFLDHETAKIDALVEEQQRLIELLKEKRQAVISQAVTKGLDPNVPMKDSGVEWLGKVPAHWEVGPLKRFWTVTDCKHITAEFVEGGIPLASIREVQGWSVDLSSAKQTTEHFYDQLIEGGRKPVSGDIIFTRNATVGEAALVPEDGPIFAMGQDVCLFRRIDLAYSAPFMLRQLKSSVIATQLEGIMIGSTFKRINVEEIRCLTVCMPTFDEQREIAAALEQEADRFDALLNAAAQASLFLQERRAALISAAVSGKIDVRGFT